MKPVFEENTDRTSPKSYLFWCVGCECLHQVRVEPIFDGARTIPGWSWDGDLISPTTNPSIKTFWPKPDPKNPDVLREWVCHLFIRSGQIQYCGDSSHDFAGKTVPMIPVEDWPV